MKITEIRFPCGELSLEGILNVPEGEGPFPAVIVCHPHPLYGGSMDNNVVYSLAGALVLVSLISFKFNFRGVGESQGQFGRGIGEQEDVGAAISFVSGLPEVDSAKLGLVGYSAGAGFAFPAGVRDARIKALAAVSPPLSMFDFESLKDCLKPKLLISGDGDDFTPASQFFEFCRNLPEPKECLGISGADHFWRGYESELADKVAEFFTRALA
ncbi:alpha/beta hydrolase [Chloroflexota bacterium]